MNVKRPKHELLAAAALLLAFLLLTCAAHADPIIFTLTNSSLSGAPGATLTFQGTILNAGAPTVFINGDSTTTSSGFLSIDDTFFFANVPLSLDPNVSVGPVNLFSVLIAPGTSFGTYAFNFFNIVGGPDASTQNLLATQTFTVTVVPEPATALLLATGLCLLRRMRRRATGQGIREGEWEGN